MEEKEKIIKKTAELVFEDALKIIKPVGWWAKVLFAGIICGAGSVFLFWVRNRIKGWFKSEIFEEDYRAKRVLDNFTGVIVMVLSFYILISEVVPFVFQVEQLLHPIGIKFLIGANLIGGVGEGLYYLSNKRSQAEVLLKKKTEEKIKIEGNKKETPKVTGRVNT